MTACDTRRAYWPLHWLLIRRIGVTALLIAGMNVAAV
jgi:hypothetical protein